jgi:hypothetical protein
MKEKTEEKSETVTNEFEKTEPFPSGECVSKLIGGTTSTIEFVIEHWEAAV